MVVIWMHARHVLLQLRKWGAGNVYHLAGQNYKVNIASTKDFRASGLDQVRRLTAATAAITLARLFVGMLCYVLERLHSSCVLSTRIGLHRIEVINKTLSKIFFNFLFIHV